MTDIGWVGLGFSGILVGVAVTLSMWRQLGLEATIVWAAARALAQLLLIGLVLDALLQPGVSSSWAWLWVAAMVVVASATAARRAPNVPGLFTLALAAFTTSAVLTLGVLFGFGVFAVNVRTIVPLAGLLIGNSMAATVLAARRIVEELGDKRDEVEARLALGQSAEEAARPYLRNALRTALTPQIETTKIVGLVALPGAMTGLILAGVDVYDAVRVQAAVMYLVLGSCAATTSVVALGIRRRVFTADHRLADTIAPAPR
jgi:putative ABC transport system permease protein